METNYTKGEWKYELLSGRKRTSVVVMTNKAIINVYTLDPDEDCNNPDCSCISEHIANAKLIAAAPEMLEALMHIVERINTVRPEDSFCQALKDTANEIIKKATK